MPPGPPCHDDRYYLEDEEGYVFSEPYYPPVTSTAPSSRPQMISVPSASSTTTRRQPVTVATNTATTRPRPALEEQVSPLETRPARKPTNASSSQTPLSPQRVGTVSSGGRHTVSPASSIHEDQEEDIVQQGDSDDVDQEQLQQYYVYGSGGGTALGLSSPPHHQHHQAAAQSGWQAAGNAGSFQQQQQQQQHQAQQQQQQQQQQQYNESLSAPSWPRQQSQQQQQLPVPQRPDVPRTESYPPIWLAYATQNKDLPPVPQPSPPQPLRSHPVDVPFPPSQYWRGSRDLRELNEARARAAQPGKGPIRTSYGPAPEPTLSTSGPPVTASWLNITPPPSERQPPREEEITPVPPSAWRSTTQTNSTPNLRHHSRSTTSQNVVPERLRQSQQRKSRPSNLTRLSSGRGNHANSGPFMHYEDLDYFNPGPGTEPKDESQIDGQIPRQDAIPDVPSINKKYLKAQRSWDRQRRRKKQQHGTGYGSQGCFGYLGCWIVELTCCFISLVCLALTIAVFKIHEGQSLSEWPMAISLNTLVGFLVAIAQAALVVPLGEGLSQLKWNSFARGEKDIRDYGVFEDARRTPIGGIKLMLKRKGRALGMSAAALLATAFLLSPLTQAAITYPLSDGGSGIAVGGTATVPRSEAYTHPEPYNALSPAEITSIHSSLFQPSSSPIAHLSPTCSTGSCTFPDFSSLAICSSTADITPRLNVSPPTLVSPRATLPNGILLTTGNLNITSAVNASFLPVRNTLGFITGDDTGKTTSGIANLFLIYTTSDESTSALEILFYFCVNTYRVEVSEGVAKTEVVHSSALSSSSTSRVVVGKRQGEYTVNREHASYLHRYLLGLFNGNYSTNSPGQIGSSGRVLGEATSSVAGNDDAREVVGNITSNIALGLTNALRASPNAGGRVILASGTATTPGGTGDRVISIHWPYLSFLIIQVSATVIFLLGIMIQTAVWDVPVLKGDQLAGLVAVSSTDKARLEDYMEDEREGITAAADKETGGEEATGGVRNRGRRGLKGVKGRFVDRGGEWGLEVVVDLGNGVHNRGSNGEVFGGNNGNGNGNGVT
ncbi:uncharacterized protein PODANS_1_11590 [Podospora anserina S mat+]|uniref:Podospora anserina S mat+ genomic DNA chromosome 1, supercontig 2 n=1 Tax=Podospora anserina (strain S / ATCC MYA-4624 / DSM 980 / FGSC 10383) TaxID=515849 RepID=B2AYM3_PODAN|nr:uncharacterized protein PODANS_1_11590 [Podospora anserina S mat+]CAP69497.1 unnamed protein product [Podospora anserina S mat+]CDP23517.1 Putative protein of unknown function [Podospora anserina S mat+]